MGKVTYAGHSLHGKTVEIDGEEWIELRSSKPHRPRWKLGYQIPMPEGHVIVLPKEKVRVLVEAAE